MSNDPQPDHPEVSQPIETVPGQEGKGHAKQAEKGVGKENAPGQNK